MEIKNDFNLEWRNEKFQYFDENIGYSKSFGEYTRNFTKRYATYSIYCVHNNIFLSNYCIGYIL